MCMENMCRVCGRNNICEKGLNLFETANRRLLKHIYLLSGLRLKVLPEAPVFICHCCQSDLRASMTFRKRCLKIQKKWETSVSQEEGQVSESDSSISTQALPAPKLRKRSCSAVSSYMEFETELPEVKPQETVHVIIEEEVDHEQNWLSEEHDQLDFENELKSANEDEDYVPPKKPRKTKNEVNQYICELCGLHVNSKASLERHIRKHTGERPFVCEQCPAKFLSAAELRAHHRVHSGERPFPCRFCDRKYVSYMGRLKHERNHTNERPFVCDECGKQFTNSFILKNHMLVHTGERLFRCDLCNRSFQRKTHLRTHYRSNTHQQNVEKQQLQPCPTGEM